MGSTVSMTGYKLVCLTKGSTVHLPQEMKECSSNDANKLEQLGQTRRQPHRPKKVGSVVYQDFLLYIRSAQTLFRNGCFPSR